MDRSQRALLRHPAGVTELVVLPGAEGVTAELEGWAAPRTVFVVTSRPVWELHGERVLGGLASTADAWALLEVPDGEAAKTPAVAADLWERMLAAGGRRDSGLLTFGGGSVGDLGGFVASTFMRGLSLVHVPTTLLAQVDAAVGGKTAINLAGAKNPVGTFHHPHQVVACVDCLGTLPGRQLRAGLVEAIKMAALLDLDLLARIEDDLAHLLTPAGSAPAVVVAAAQRAKVGVVERDPDERGERRVLNFGHTLAHAIEAASGYEGLLHGEAVAYGMLFALELAATRGLDPAFMQRLEALIERLELPPLPVAQADRWLELTTRDKKAGPDGVVWVLPTAPGSWEAAHLPAAEVEEALDRFVARASPPC